MKTQTPTQQATRSKKRRMLDIVRLAGWAVLIYAAYCGFLYLMQTKMMFPAGMADPGFGTPTPPDGAEKLWVRTSFGKVEAWFMPAENLGEGEQAPAVIFAHGNAELIDFWPPEMKRLTEMGIGALLVEFPGYGRSDGRAGQETVTETFVNAYDMLIRRADVDPARIILTGRSMGGGAVCRLALQRPSAAMILMSTFTSARSFARQYLAPGFLVRHPFDNQASVSAYPHPVLIIHGTHDSVIPYRHGVALSEAARNGRLISYNADHNDCPPDWDVFWRDVAAFLRQNGLLKRE